jgi:inorganic pyrophosphatase
MARWRYALIVIENLFRSTELRADLVQISKEETLNPIKQDIKKGKLRYVRNCFPHHGYLWNYGCFPQVLSPHRIHSTQS